MVVSRLNRQIEGTFDSRQLAFLSALIHPMTVEGTFTCRLLSLGAPSSEETAPRSISVAAQIVVTVTAASSTQQVPIDLADTAHAPATIELAPSGYLLFHFSDEAGRFAVTLSHIDAEGQEVEDYSSLALQQGDVFAAILLEEGVFELANLVNGAACELSVAAAPIKSQLDDAYELIADANGFTPARVDVDLGGTLSINVQLADSVLVSRLAVQPPGPDRPVR